MISRYLPNTSSYQGRMVGSTGLWVTHSVMVHPQLKHNELPMSGALVGVESHNSSTYPSIHLEEWASWWVLVHSSVLSTGWPLDTAQRQTIHMIQQQCSKKPKSMDGTLVAAGSQNSFIHPSIHSSIHSFIYLSIHLSIHSFIHPSIHSSIHPSIHPCALAGVSLCVHCVHWTGWPLNRAERQEAAWHSTAL